MTEIPKRRQKWYCPDCRVKKGIDESGNPVVVIKGRGKK